MTKNKTINYWLFQANPKVFRLKEALRAGLLQSFAVVTHKDRIKEGDKVILWESGKNAGCYGLATITSAVGEVAVPQDEGGFFREALPDASRVKLKVDYNIWNRPITKDILPKSQSFEQFYAGLPGTNYSATEEQFKALENLIQQMELVNETEVAYQPILKEAIPHNQILFGPPGTGKTFQTLNYALSIIEGRSLEELALEDRFELRRRYEEYLQAGRIAFVSFHQSFSYEDFVEGIKPQTVNGNVHYHIEDGVFKIIAGYARRCLLDALFAANPPAAPQVQFDQLYKAFLNHLKSGAIDYFLGIKDHRFFFHRILRFGNIAVRAAKTFSVQTVKSAQLKRLYDFFLENETAEIAEAEIQKIIGKGNPDAIWAVFKTFKAFEAAHLETLEIEAAVEPDVEDEQLEEIELPVVTEDILARCNKYVLIIDEINRGNIPAIFGELISLIEADKRDGAAEALTVVLPYSKNYFSVPVNLYILGTMNSVDRSAEAMDIALRRRFVFRSLDPQPDLISKLASKPNPAGIDLKKLLDAMNQRIELLLDKDHTIGHAYFLNIENLAELKNAFTQTIIPMLNEYFFNDLGKIGLVLGKDFVIEKDLVDDNLRDSVFADFDHPYASEFAEKRLYEIRPIEDLNEAAFIRIYDKTYRD